MKEMLQLYACNLIKAIYMYRNYTQKQTLKIAKLLSVFIKFCIPTMEYPSDSDHLLQRRITPEMIIEQRQEHLNKMRFPLLKEVLKKAHDIDVTPTRSLD